MPDETVLTEAQKNGLTLVTFDLATIAPLVKSWGESGLEHGGIIFVDECTVAPNDFGGLIRALGEIWEGPKKLSWTNRVAFLSTRRG